MYKKIIAVLLVVFIEILIGATQAVTTFANTDRTPPIDIQNPAPAGTPSDPISALQSAGLSPNWNFGPVSISGKYDSLLKGIAQAIYADKLGEHWAAGLIGEAGPNNYRLNGTLGAQLWDDTQFKLTGEYLDQRLPFDFSQGQVDERVSQSALGAQVRQNFHNPVFKNVQAGGYWAYAPGTELAEQTLIQDALQYTYQRHIAGSNTRGASIGTDMVLTPLTTLNASLLYDSVTYDTKLTSASPYNRSGLGASLKLDQIISDTVKFKLSAEDRTIQNSYGGELHWAPQLAPLGLDMALSAQRLVSGNQLPGSNVFGIQFSFALNGGASSGYRATAPDDHMGDLLSWVKDPAVRMDRVQAMAEQKITLNGPVALSVTPNNGPITGGGTVTINGSNFLPGVIVTFAGVNAHVVSVTPTQIVVTVPDLSTVVVQNMPSLLDRMLTALSPVSDAWAAPPTTRVIDIVVRNPNGQSMTFKQAYTFSASNPVLTSLSPTSGSTLGGTAVTLTGLNFTGASSVTFGGTAATGLQVVNDTTITATAPAHAAGAVDVVVTAPQGSGTLTGGFTYVAPVPTVTSLTPISGTTNGGTSVTLTGTHFTGATSVTFGGTAATGVSIVNDTTLTASTPAHAPGAVNVVVTNPSGSGTLTNGYNYSAPPAITMVSPSSGITSGGTSVTINGTGLSNATVVHFGATAATVVSNSATSITVTSPSGSAGTVDITVTTAIGTSPTSNADQFTYTAAPGLTSAAPNTGPTAGGTSVTLTGTNLTGATGVTFGGTAASGFTVNSATQITATTSTHAAGTVDVVVTTPGGSHTLSNGFTYAAAPTFTSISPTSGVTAGGTPVTITGTNLTGTSSVTFGGTAATSVTVVSSIQVTAVYSGGQAQAR